MSRSLNALLAATTLTVFAGTSLAQDKSPAPASPTPPATPTTPAKPDKSQDPVKTDSARVGDPYPMDFCPITTKKLGSMGDPIVKIYDGREVRYCCEGCIKTFEKDKAASFAKLDEKMIKDQVPLYPLKTSVVTGKDLPAKPFDFVHGNRLVRVGSEGEKADFLKDAPKFLAALNKAATESQLKDYPLKTCPASQETLEGHEGKPVDMVLAGRLIRLCCKDCVKAVEKDPAKFIALIDAARKGEKPKPDADPKNKSDKKSDSKGG